MSYISIENVKISGISACVPASIDYVNEYQLFTDSDSEKFFKTTGIEKRRRADEDTCSSDLCLQAAEKLIEELNWNRDEIDCLIFVTQTPDYVLPATSAILQERLGLSTNCYTLDISSGCSGWVDGLSVISSILSRGSIKKGLLLAGDTPLKMCSKTDKSTYPLFGDAGTATALEFTHEENSIQFSFNSDGSGYKAIIIEDGGFRNPVTADSFVKETIDTDIERSRLDVILEGMDVFSFGITRAPESIQGLVNQYSIDLEKIDYFTFHQANMFMNEKIRKKLKLPIEKVPYSLKDFGNTSCATIPLTLVSQLKNELNDKELSHIACGFGVGLSWGSCHFKTNKIVCTELIEL